MPISKELFIHLSYHVLIFVTCKYGGISATSLARLQSVQNAAARLLKRVKKYDSISPVLANLSWLPVCFRVKYKIWIVVYKSLNNQAPLYLTNLLIPYNPPRALRSENDKLLVVPRTIRHQKGDKAFAVMGPRLWNELPLYIRSAKSVNV